MLSFLPGSLAHHYAARPHHRQQTTLSTSSHWCAIDMTAVQLIPVSVFFDDDDHQTSPLVSSPCPWYAADGSVVQFVPASPHIHDGEPSLVDFDAFRRLGAVSVSPIARPPRHESSYTLFGKKDLFVNEYQGCRRCALDIHPAAHSARETPPASLPVIPTVDAKDKIPQHITEKVSRLLSPPPAEPFIPTADYDVPPPYSARAKTPRRLSFFEESSPSNDTLMNRALSELLCGPWREERADEVPNLEPLVVYMMDYSTSPSGSKDDGNAKKQDEDSADSDLSLPPYSEDEVDEEDEQDDDVRDAKEQEDSQSVSSLPPFSEGDDNDEDELEVDADDEEEDDKDEKAEAEDSDDEDDPQLKGLKEMIKERRMLLELQEKLEMRRARKMKEDAN
ncbi:hypothetical protein BGX33_012589 [Mortierella sp. NVP41]|nr:hypothetical protein BGX33_012589 [Mortierella sp. NVP41]